MAAPNCVLATEKDIPFISEVYLENLAQLHGIPRSDETWKELLARKDTVYYIVYTEEPVAWFRLDREAEALWLGMLQVKPAHQRKGLGKYILSVFESIAGAQGIRKLGIHTTEDNLAARALYGSAGYSVTEIGPCTTADGMDRVGYTFEKGLLFSEER